MSQLPSSLPGVDVASGLPRVAGNAKLYLKLLRQVAAGAPETQRKLAEAVANGDAKQVRDIAHSLKGASSNLSITEVALAAEHLETAAKAEDFTVLFARLDALDEALNQYVAVIQSIPE